MIENLQALRAFAAINVVFFHIIGTGTAYGFSPNIFDFLRGWGASGVDIFFIISGFVMMHTQFKKKRNIYEFMRTRIIRIVPIYWFITFVVIISYYVLPGSAFNSENPSFSFAIESLLFLSGLVSQQSPIIFVGWTVEWEMFFYLVFAISIILPNLRSGLFFISVVLVLVAFINENLILLEFLIGILIALFYYKKKINKNFASLILLIGFTILFADNFNKYYFTNERIIHWGLPSALIVLGAIYSPQLRSKTIRLLGDASYSIYLIQILTLPVFYKLAKNFNLYFNHDFLAIFCLIFSILAGLATYIFIERPMILYLKKFSL